MKELQSKQQSLHNWVTTLPRSCWILYRLVFCSGQEHHRLWHCPSQLKLIDTAGNTPYLVYEEDVSKTNQGGLEHRKCKKRNDNPQLNSSL